MSTTATLSRPAVVNEPIPSSDVVDLPSVTIDPDRCEINVNVTVFPPQEEGGSLILRVPVLAIPGPVPPAYSSRWTVTWTLLPQGNLRRPKFADAIGIEIPSTKNSFMPANVSLFDAGILDLELPYQWRAIIDNGVSGANSLQYDIVVDPDPLDKARRVTRHDPTIAVIKDPLDPPPPTYPGGEETRTWNSGLARKESKKGISKK
ncbi:MAG TPA: hypothetical protein VIE43_03120 [Thermoanaerobaculia bacterium]|nr:hypothetical protein [Thermoanaerobaculia bacterium]